MAHLIVNPTSATAYLTDNVAPNLPDTVAILHVCSPVNSVFDVCGLTDRQKLALIRQGINTMASLRLLGNTCDEIRDSLKPVMSLRANRGGCEFSINTITSLAALSSFYRDCRRRGLPLDPFSFTSASLDDWTERVLQADDDSDDELVPSPGKLDIDNFLTWKEALDLKLKSMRGSAQTPLYYVIRPDLPHDYGDSPTNAEDKLIYETRQQGHEWNQDNKKVARFVLGLVQPTDGYQWVRDVSPFDGRGIVQALVNHYEGEGHSQRIVESARHTVSNLVYQNESVFSWETFSTRIKQAFDVLHRHCVPVPLPEQLHTVRRKIKTSNPEFNALAKGVLTGNHAQSLTWHLSQVAVHVSTEFPRTLSQRSSFKRKNISSVASGATEQNDPDYHVETRNGRRYCNGVDITEKVKQYDPADWRRLPRTLRREIYTEKRSTTKRARSADISQLMVTVAEMNTRIAELRQHATGDGNGIADADGNQEGGDGRRVSFGPPHGPLRRNA